MSKSDKQLARFLSIPSDFTWDELISVLARYDFSERKGNGSRRCFIDAENKKLFLHKPHPENVVKKYAIRQVKHKLVEYGVIQDSGDEDEQ